MSTSASTASLLGGCTFPSSSSLFLASTPRYHVHPLVIFSILDHYHRRNVGQQRVVGTLLGSVEGNVIEVKQAFPVPHQEEEDSATIEIDYHHSMLGLHRQVSPKDVVVGWYSTTGSSEADDKSKAPSLNYVTSLLHDVYRTQMNVAPNVEPLHLTVDVSMKGGMKIAGYINSVVRTKTNGNGNANSASSSSNTTTDLLSHFLPVPVTLDAYEEEQIGVDALISGVPDDDSRLDAPATILSDSENLEQSVMKVLECMETIESYIQRVAAGKIENPDAKLAVQIHQLLASMPVIDSNNFQQTFATHIQDMLSIVYLANMTKNQLAIADKANVLV